MPWGLAANIGSSLIGGILGNRNAKKERRRSIRDQREQFSRIRESAEKAGFNPLTALGSVASGGFRNLPSGTIAPLASVELASNALRGVADVATGEKARRRDAQAVQDRLQRLKLERLEAGQAGAIAARTNGAVMTQRKAPPVSTVGSSTRPPTGGTERLVFPEGYDTDDPGKPLRFPDDRGKTVQKALDTAATYNPGRHLEAAPSVDAPLFATRTWNGMTVPCITSDGEECADMFEIVSMVPNMAASYGINSARDAYNQFDPNDWGNQLKGAKRRDGKGKPSEPKYDPQHFMRQWQSRKGKL